jgi:hypothetical protein
MNRRDVETPGGFIFTKNENLLTRSRHVSNADVLLARQIESGHELSATSCAGTKISDRAL